MIIFKIWDVYISPTVSRRIEEAASTKSTTTRYRSLHNDMCIEVLDSNHRLPIGGKIQKFIQDYYDDRKLKTLLISSVYE